MVKRLKTERSKSLSKQSTQKKQAAKLTSIKNIKKNKITIDKIQKNIKKISDSLEQIQHNLNLEDKGWDALSPAEIVAYLDQFIIGQTEAKRKVAIAARNRVRRRKLPLDMQVRIRPKNILMIGPTGVGKTEIARCLAEKIEAPFIRIEATKFTEIGFIGRNVESMVVDLVTVAFNMLREQSIKRNRQAAMPLVEQKILDLLIPHAKSNAASPANSVSPEPPSEQNNDAAIYEFFKKQLLSGELDDREIEVEVSQTSQSVGVDLFAPPGMEEVLSQLGSVFQQFSKRPKKKRKLKIKQAREVLLEEIAITQLDEEALKQQALDYTEQNGIIFLDEIDKICRRADQTHGPDVSREGVQRDLLPLVEGCTVMTKYGMVKTDHILFIAAGAFHSVKPSDLMPELQGRFPVRVELKALTTEDFKRILVEPEYSLLQQYTALLNTEGLSLSFLPESIEEIAIIASEINRNQENINARRLWTVIENLLEDILFDTVHSPHLLKSEKNENEKIMIDREYVRKKLKKLRENEDLSRYIL